MTKTTPSSPNTTFDWLLNTLTNSLKSAKERVLFWRDRRSFATERREAEKPANGGSYDRSEYDRWCEVIRINDQFEVSTELLGRLIVKVEGNPYPGERRSVLKLAVDLIPEGGKVGWRAIFQDPDFKFPRNFENERITFPAEVSVDVREIERRLLELAREDRTIAAAEVAPCLGMVANGKAFRVVKERLEERKWVWSKRREGGKLVRIVIPPA